MKRLFDKDTWQEIFGSIQKNKIRTIITMIGVLWGIFIYIALSGSSKGLDNGFERQFQSIASNSIKYYLQKTLIDPDSMRVSCAESKKGWIRELGGGFKPPKYGWVVYCDVNSKNRLGGYAGSRPYAFLFINSDLIYTYSDARIGWDFDFSPY